MSNIDKILGGNSTLPLNVTVVGLPPPPVSSNVFVTNFPATQPVSGSVGVNNFPAVYPVNDNGGSLTVDGTVAVSNFPATQPVSGTVGVNNFPVVYPVNDNGGSLTVDGSVGVNNFPAVQTITGSVIVTSAPPAVINSSIDAFNRIRVSNALTLLQVDSEYDDNSDLFLEKINSGTGLSPVHNPSARIVELTVNPGVGSSRLQSYEYCRCYPGKSQLIFVNFIMNVAVINVDKEIGYFDENDGIFLTQKGTTGLFIVRRTSVSGAPVDEVINQLSWNKDTMNGLGPSGITLNINLAQILMIDLNFAMGRIRCNFIINGQIIPFHVFDASNTIAASTMKTGSLPFQGRVNASGSVVAANMSFKSVCVISEGTAFGIRPSLTVSSNYVVMPATVNGVRTHLISFRPKLLFKGLPNRTMIQTMNINLSNESNKPVFYEICIGATFTVAPVFAGVSNLSATEFGTGGTFGNLTNGIVLESGFLLSTNQTKMTKEIVIPFQYPLTLNAAGAHRAMGTYTVLVTDIGSIGGFVGVQGSIDVFEFH